MVESLSYSNFITPRYRMLKFIPRLTVYPKFCCPLESSFKAKVLHHELNPCFNQRVLVRRIKAGE